MLKMAVPSEEFVDLKDMTMKHMRSITIPRKGADTVNSVGLGYLVFGLLALLGGLTIGIKPSASNA